ncbi:uncharacterized protein SETTUDRAFT_103556 [Exserohilum turcica Et28A]|uniref:MACPF-like domain-containing protein n=1 Tax=Exserohilum turcicum (strain 28A) TaxID=671987 RepID=R0IZP4_EXST2|nr:uncharacterized protein SETTUDRAFT_103556 [Exserohilum turcica Et28A]EOA90185.1 hypothetical protein SETTUDRAFT_103556 [Exserohilum turcica Et28A]
MASPKFHIVVDGPVGTSFPSFPSSDLEQGDVTKIILSMIRNKSAVPDKFFFTIDGKSKVDDATTLAYYMSLQAEVGLHLARASHSCLQDQGQKILQANKAQPSPPAGGSEPPKPDAPKPDAPKPDASKPDASKPAAAEPGIQTFRVQVTNNLAALSGNYATNAGSKAYLEPGDLDGTQWDAVFRNNRVLHGYFYQWSGANDARPILVKARKPAFNLRGAGPVPAIPPFYIDDDASVGIVEIRTQFQHTLIKEGFDSVAVGGSLGGGAASIPATVTASFEKEHSTVSSTSTSTSVDSLVATYNFPRVVVELDPECLVLTDECRADAMHITDDASQARFFRTYGKIFVTKFTLGGYLHSTRNVSSKEQSSLEQVKDRTRIAAGLSIQTPKASGGINVAKVESTVTETGVASLLQDAHLTWNARGGDTLLCSNPPAWASTVKDYKMWRLMNVSRKPIHSKFPELTISIATQACNSGWSHKGRRCCGLAKDRSAIYRATTIWRHPEGS